MCCLYKTTLNTKTKIKVYKKVNHANANQKETSGFINIR